MRKNFTHYYFTVLLFVLFFQAIAVGQKNGLTANEDQLRGNWAANPFEAKFFIENKGQFDGKGGQLSSQILFGVDNEGVKVYFSSRGLSYRFDKIVSGQEEGEGDERPEAVSRQSWFVNMEFLNANPGVQVIAEDEARGYFNYTERELAKPVYHATAFNKIIYKNIYEGIDVEYTFHPEHGIKYAIVLHPGADATKVQMHYNGIAGIRKDDESGDMLLSTEIGDIRDHAPVTYYEADRASIASAFLKSGNTVMFQLGHYDNTKAVIIDPWSVFPSFGGTYNRALNVKTDKFGSVFAYGSYNPCKLVKYNSAGTLKWSVNSPYGIWIGGLAPDNQGNVYISGLYGVTKYDSTGVIVWDTTYAPSIECWRLSFDPSFTKLYMAGSLQASMAYELSTADGSIISSNDIGGGEEVRAMCTAPNGNLYTVIASSGAMVAATPSLTNIYTKSSGGLMLYYGNYGNPPTNGSSHTCPTNSIAADSKYVYCFDGRIIAKINITSGAILASKVVTGVSSSQLYGGIAVDGCGNIYVGSINKVVEFDSLLIQVKTFATTGAVYDVTISEAGAIIGSGDGFIASLGTVAPQCLTTTVIPPNAGFTASDTVFCAGDCISFNNLSLNATSYQWFFPGATPSSSAAANPPFVCYFTEGNYDVKLIATGGGGVDSMKLTGYIHVMPTPPTPVITLSHDTLYCSYSPSYSSYQWYKDSTAIPGGTGTYIVISEDGNYNLEVGNASDCRIGTGISVILGTDQVPVSGLQFSVSPNPVGDEFTIHDSQFGIGSIEIYNVLGEKILPSSVFRLASSIVVDVSLITPGVYFIQLHGESENITRKFVKK